MHQHSNFKFGSPCCLRTVCFQLLQYKNKKEKTLQIPTIHMNNPHQTCVIISVVFNEYISAQCYKMYKSIQLVYGKAMGKYTNVSKLTGRVVVKRLLSRAKCPCWAYSNPACTLPPVLPLRCFLHGFPTVFLST